MLPKPVAELESDGLEPLEEEPVPAPELIPLASVPLEPEGLALPLVPEGLLVEPEGVVALGEPPVSTLLDVLGEEVEPLGADVSGDGAEAGLPSFLLLSQADNPKPKAAANNVGITIFLESVWDFIFKSPFSDNF